MKAVVSIIRIFVGSLFIFSGMIKVNDPVGMAIKLEEYFEVFGTQFLSPAALFLAVFVVVLEVALGVALLTGYKTKLTLWALLGLIVFFTGLTFYSAYFNKVTDCGCFGDAIKLTPWQSFGKDVILLVLILLLIVFQKDFQSFFSDSRAILITYSSTGISLLLALYCINFLPIIDFRAYKIGNSIPQLMQPSEPYQYRYLMSRNGEEQYFNEYPTEGGWEYVNMELMNPQAQPKITDYNLWNEEGDATSASFEGKLILIIVQSVDKTSLSGLKKMYELAKSFENYPDMKVWVVTSSDLGRFKEMRHELQLAIPYYFADATVLKTIIRSNPGLVLLKDGVVKGKWHYNLVPDKDEVLETFDQ